MVCESEHAESNQDFIHKLAIAQKEANETEYWIELLFQSQLINEKAYKSIVVDVKELEKNKYPCSKAQNIKIDTYKQK